MQFIDIPTEQTTAATDVVLAGLAFFATYLMWHAGQKAPWKSRIWVWIFSLLGIGSILGAFFHGFQHTLAVKKLIWFPMLFLFSIVVALFLVAMLYDARGERSARRILPVMLMVGSLAFGVVAFNEGNFFVLILYETLAMLVALVGYILAAIKTGSSGNRFMAAGVAVTILAAAVQATASLSFTLVWEFDHNSVFHFIQMLGILFFILGLRSGDSNRGSDFGSSSISS